MYALTVATTGALGPRIRRSDLDCRAAMKPQPAPLPPGQGPPCSTKTPPGRLFANTFSMPVIASLLSRYVDRPVVDATGLVGAFDIELEKLWTSRRRRTTSRDRATSRCRPQRAPQTPFIAVREQLGLRLEPRRGQVVVIVVDAAERPNAL